MKRSSMSIMNELDVLRDLSEEEKQAIAAQQKRSDKISSLMGEYLLKGWRMLDESCPKCGVCPRNLRLTSCLLDDSVHAEIRKKILCRML